MPPPPKPPPDDPLNLDALAFPDQMKTQPPPPPPPAKPAAMIVPAAPAKSASGLTTYQQDWLWGQQWQKHDPKRRFVVEVSAASGRDGFLAAVSAAATKAGEGGEVLLSVGHGTAGDGAQAAFDTLPELPEHALSQHKFSITREVVDLTDHAQKDAQGKWVSKSSTDSFSTKLDDLGRRHDLISDAGKALRAAKVKTFTVLACNVGQDLRAAGGLRFHQRLATILGVDVAVYSGFVAMDTATLDPGGTHLQLWITTSRTNPDEGRPLVPGSSEPEADKQAKLKAIETSFHEVPSRLRETASAPKQGG